MKQLYIGAPMWGMSEWKGGFFQRQIKPNDYLNSYSRYYSSVEGNTTFYALPTIEKVEQWAEQVSSGFKFCFKLPRSITHEVGLTASFKQFESFAQLLEPISTQGKLGQLSIQLPPHFNGLYLNQLATFLSTFSSDFNFNVEMRHMDYFSKGEEERTLNRLLIEHKVNRVMLDTRPVHAEPSNTEAIIDAQKKKPKLPVHILATANNPMVRYIGQTNLDANIPYIQSWLPFFKQWLEEGKSPYLFIHTADNVNMHLLTRLWHKMLTEHLGFAPFEDSRWPGELEKLEQEKQSSLF